MVAAGTLPAWAEDAKRSDPATMLKDAAVEVYKTMGEVRLHIYLFTPEGHKATDRRPAIVFFSGGGWLRQSPTQFAPHCCYLASRGMVAMAAEYRVKNPHGTTPRECVQDGKSAIRWVRANAARLGIDPNRLAAGGGSAGGHVAAAAGTLDGLNEPGEDTSISSRPNALVLFNPVFDNGPDGFGYDRVKDYYREISPLDNIKPGAPPTIAFFGTADALVPVATARKYKAKMEAAGSRCDLCLYEGQPHAFFNYKNNGGKYYRQTLREADKFLASLGYLTGEPTIAAE